MFRMCGRYTLTPENKELERRFNFYVADSVKIGHRYNIAPSQEAPVIVWDGAGGKRTLKMMRWGLIPGWARDKSIGYKMINARAETVNQKPSFMMPFRKRRCLVIADSFYEWKKTGNNKVKIPVRFMLKDEKPFAFAGLWDTWDPPEGERILSYSIITTSANEIIKPVHDRSPVILREKDEDIWLDPDVKDDDSLLPLLSPYDSDMMKCYPVSNIVNSPENDSPECIEPVEHKGATGSLL